MDSKTQISVKLYGTETFIEVTTNERYALVKLYLPGNDSVRPYLITMKAHTNLNLTEKTILGFLSNDLVKKDFERFKSLNAAWLRTSATDSNSKTFLESKLPLDFDPFKYFQEYFGSKISRI